MKLSTMVLAGLFAAPAFADLPSQCNVQQPFKGTMECSHTHPAGCIIPVPVQTTSGGCTVSLPYDLLCVRTRRDEPGSPPPFTPTIRWILTENGQVSSNYVFDSSSGISMSPPNSEFTNPTIDDTLVLFTWDTGPNEGSVSHLPVVRPRAGGANCTVVDPLAVNVGS